jgi:hypothetical protein
LYALLNSFDSIFSFVQDVITHSQKKSEKLRAVVSGHQELAALEKRVDDEKTKNLYTRSSSKSKRKRTKVSHCFP